VITKKRGDSADYFIAVGILNLIEDG